jgi:hypothetical protein
MEDLMGNGTLLNVAVGRITSTPLSEVNFDHSAHQ